MLLLHGETSKLFYEPIKTDIGQNYTVNSFGIALEKCFRTGYNELNVRNLWH